MCQQCIKYGLATPVNKKGSVAVVRKEKKVKKEDKAGGDPKRNR